jgi:hypothetical protein
MWAKRVGACAVVVIVREHHKLQSATYLWSETTRYDAFSCGTLCAQLRLTLDVQWHRQRLRVPRFECVAVLNSACGAQQARACHAIVFKLCECGGCVVVLTSMLRVHSRAVVLCGQRGGSPSWAPHQPSGDMVYVALTAWRAWCTSAPYLAFR